MSPRPPRERPPRVSDLPGPLLRSVITEWRWPITVLVSLCLLIAAACYLLGKPVGGFVDQLSGVLTGSAVLAIVVACFRLFAAVRQMAGAERQAGGARSEVAALRADLAPLFDLLAERAPDRGAGRRREPTAGHDAVADHGEAPSDGNHRTPRFPKA